MGSETEGTVELSKQDAQQKLESFLLIGPGYKACDTNLTLLEDCLLQISDIEVIAALNKVANTVGVLQDGNNSALATVLSLCMMADNESMLRLAYAAFPKLCLSESFLFLCLHIRKELAKRKASLGKGTAGMWGEGFRNAIRKYYNSKSDIELSKMLISNQRLFKWTHKDVIRLAHIYKKEKPPVIGYFAMNISGEKNNLSDECKALAALQEELKTCEDPPRIAFLLNELNKKLTPPSSRFNTPAVWAEYVEYMPLEDVLRNLEYFNKKSLKSAVLPRVLSVINKSDGSSVDPLTVYLHLYRYSTSNYQSRKKRAIEKAKAKSQETKPKETTKSEPNVTEDTKSEPNVTEGAKKKGPRKSKKKEKAFETELLELKSQLSDLKALISGKPVQQRTVVKPNEPDSDLVSAVEKLLKRSLAAVKKKDEDWLMVTSFSGSIEKQEHGWHVPFSAIATGLAMHLSAAASSLTVLAPSVGEVAIDTASAANTLTNFSKVKKQKCPKEIVEWTLSSENKASKILILTDEPFASEEAIVAAMKAYREKKSLPNASLLIFGTYGESSIIEHGIWKCKGFQPNILPLFCRYCSGELRLFKSP